MRINNIEILRRTSSNNYDEILYPKTSISNVEVRENVFLDEDIRGYLNSIKDNVSISTSNYLINESGVTVIDINNINYVYLDSLLEIYYNGLLLVEDYHYRVVDSNKIELLKFESKENDEVIFKVYNKFKTNIDFDYKNLPKNHSEALDALISSINLYYSEVLKFKSELILYLNNLDVDVSLETSFSSLSKSIFDNLKEKNILSDDFGHIFGKPYFSYDISFNLGGLFGTENNVSYFGNDLGALAFDHKKHLSTSDDKVIVTDYDRPILVNKEGEING